MNGMYTGDPETDWNGTEEKLLRKDGLLLRTSRINSLDGLRGVACIVVMLLHVAWDHEPLDSDGYYGGGFSCCCRSLLALYREAEHQAFA